jgi:hypothetical protein
MWRRRLPKGEARGRRPPARVSFPAPPIRHVGARCIGLLALPLPPLACACFAGYQFDFCSGLTDGGSFWGGVEGGNAKLLKASKVDKEYDAGVFFTDRYILTTTQL